MRVRVVAVLLALGITVTAACGTKDATDSHGASAEVMVFAAASLRDAVQEVGQLYQQRTGATISFNFAGSNELAQQIVASSKADVYLTANEKWMDKVAAAGRVEEGTRRQLLSNQLVVVARDDSPYRMSTPSDLATLPYRQLVLANPDAVPAGIYAREWLTSIPDDTAAGATGTLWEAVLPKVVPTADVRAALALVESDPELVGIVYRTDDFNSRRVRTLYQVPVDDGPKIIYDAAVIAGGPNTEGGRGFLAFLGEREASKVFRQYGFIVRQK